VASSRCSSGSLIVRRSVSAGRGPWASASQKPLRNQPRGWELVSGISLNNEKAGQRYSSDGIFNNLYRTAEELLGRKE